MSTDIIEELMASNDTKKKVEVIFGDLENKGEVPPRTTEAIESLLTGNSDESLNALGTLCNIVSANQTNDTGAVDCDKLEVSGGESGTTTIEGFWGELGKIVFGILVEKPIDKATEHEGIIAEWCKLNPGKCT
jgi:hypothetical protein